MTIKVYQVYTNAILLHTFFILLLLEHLFNVIHLETQILLEEINRALVLISDDEEDEHAPTHGDKSDQAELLASIIQQVEMSLSQKSPTCNNQKMHLKSFVVS